MESEIVANVLFFEVALLGFTIVEEAFDTKSTPMHEVVSAYLGFPKQRA